MLISSSHELVRTAVATLIKLIVPIQAAVLADLAAPLSPEDSTALSVLLEELVALTSVATKYLSPERVSPISLN